MRKFKFIKQRIKLYLKQRAARATHARSVDFCIRVYYYYYMFSCRTFHGDRRLCLQRWPRRTGFDFVLMLTAGSSSTSRNATWIAARTTGQVVSFQTNIILRTVCGQTRSAYMLVIRPTPGYLTTITSSIIIVITIFLSLVSGLIPAADSWW